MGLGAAAGVVGAVGVIGVSGVVGAGVGTAAATATTRAKTINIGNHTEITVAPGWVAGKVKGAKLGLSHASPKAIIEVAVGTGETGSVATNGMANLQGFATGFGLTKVTSNLEQTAKIPGGGTFNEAASITYSGNYMGQSLGGLVVEYQNSKTTDGAFAIVIAQPNAKAKLKKDINSMFKSLATNP